MAAVGRAVTLRAADLAELRAGIEPIGRSDGGTTRLAWTPEHEAAVEQLR
jgi:hypothetical protein